MTTSDLAAFLRAHYDSLAVTIAENRGERGIGDEHWWPGPVGDQSDPDIVAAQDYITVFNPEFQLAEIEANRRILARHPGATESDECPGCGANLDGTWRTGPGQVCPELADLAAPYWRLPAYRPEWAPRR